MRVLILIGSVVMLTALSIGGAVLLTLQATDHSEWTWLSAVAMTALTIAPILPGSVLMYWDPDRSDATRRLYRRTLIITVCIQVAATILLVAYVVLSGTPLWVVPLISVVSLALTAAAVRFAPALRRSEGPSTLRAEGPVYMRVDLHRDLSRVTATGVVTLIAGAAGFFALSLAFDDGKAIEWEVFAYVPLLAVMAASIVCVLVSVRLGRQQRDLVNGDLERMRELTKGIVRGKKATLTPDDEAVAPRFAALSTVAQTYQLGQVLCVPLGLGAVQVVRFVDDPSDTVAMAISALFVVLLIVFGPLALVQLRRTRRYALDHGEVIIEPREPREAPTR